MNDTEIVTWRMRIGLPAHIPNKQGPPKGDLSANKVNLLDKCALAYSLGKIDRLDERPTDAKFRGTLVHQVLEEVGRARLTGAKTGKPTEKELRETLREKAASGARFTTGVMNSAWAVLEHLADAISFDRTISIEENWSLELPQDALAGPPFKLVGAFDRIDVDLKDRESGETTVHIHDYKSGAYALSVAELINEPQVMFYVAAVAEHWNGPIRVTFHYLGAEIPVTFLAPKDIAQRGIDLAMTKMADIRTRQKWEPYTGPHCVSCDFRTNCPAYARMVKSQNEVFPVGSDEDLLREYVRCRTLAKLFGDHKEVCGDALRAKLENQDRVIGGGLRAIISPRPVRRLPDNVQLVAETVAKTANMTPEQVVSKIVGINERKLKAFLNELPGDVRQEAEKAIDDLKEVHDVTTNLDVRALAGGF